MGEECIKNINRDVPIPECGKISRRKCQPGLRPIAVLIISRMLTVGVCPVLEYSRQSLFDFWDKTSVSAGWKPCWIQRLEKGFGGATGILKSRLLLYPRTMEKRRLPLL
jgi:hypothetical protein